MKTDNIEIEVDQLLWLHARVAAKKKQSKREKKGNKASRWGNLCFASLDSH